VKKLSLGEIFLFVGIAIAWHVNHQTRKFINKWSWENKYEVVKKQFYPIYIMIWPWGIKGIHPASYIVTIKDTKNSMRQFKVAGGGPLWLSGVFEVEEIKYNY
jgi:hypothetical protein